MISVLSVSSPQKVYSQYKAPDMEMTLNGLDFNGYYAQSRFLKLEYRFNYHYEEQDIIGKKVGKIIDKLIDEGKFEEVVAILQYLYFKHGKKGDMQKYKIYKDDKSVKKAVKVIDEFFSKGKQSYNIPKTKGIPSKIQYYGYKNKYKARNNI